MDLDRKFYGWPELQASPEAMGVMNGLQKATRRALQRYASLSEKNLEFMLMSMNQNGTDFGHKFIYEEYFGGLCHIQNSYVEGEVFLYLSPVCAEFPSLRAIDRVAMRSNGVMCTLAPESVSDMWRLAMQNNSARFHLGECRRTFIGFQDVQFTMEYMSTCAYCLKKSDTLVPCTCAMVRYCDRTCQKAHWRLGHKALCNWTMSCLAAFGPNQREE